MFKEKVAIEERVENEKFAHDVNDVLKRSYNQKKRFRHFFGNPSLVAMEKFISENLKNIEGRKILDYGCGTGNYSVELLKAGALVTGIDISTKYIEHARTRAKNLGFEGNFQFAVMDAHKLEFEAEEFDMVIGRGILHHLELPVAINEIFRVLKPGGMVLFQEPLASNPLIRLWRLLTPSARTRDERPLSKADLTYIKNWGIDNSNYYGLVCAPVSIFTSVFVPFLEPNNSLARFSFKVEKTLNKFHFLRPYNQYVLLHVVKSKA